MHATCKVQGNPHVTVPFLLKYFAPGKPFQLRQSLPNQFQLSYLKLHPLQAEKSYVSNNNGILR